MRLCYNSIKENIKMFKQCLTLEILGCLQYKFKEMK